MSKTWYPVINYKKCTECGACTNKCKNGVYDLKEAPKPIVVFPENCIQGCYGCGNLCPSKAIHYAGDTGQGIENSGCSCGEQPGGCC